MRATKMVEAFNDRYPFLGPLIWILSIQYFIVQVLVAQAWTTPFSIRLNAISDLGNTVCGIYAGRYVCSPLHALMNASFIILGITIACGSLLIYQEFNKTTASLIGFTLMGLGGIGTILVGLFPENTMFGLHTLGAALPFLLGNISLVILGASLQMPKSLRLYTIFSGVLALLALALFLCQHYLGLGFGGMERLMAYPQTLWLIVFGLYMTRTTVHS